MRTGVKRAQALPSKKSPATWSRASRAGSSLFRYLPLKDKTSDLLFCVAFSARYAHERLGFAICFTSWEGHRVNTQSAMNERCRPSSRIIESHKPVCSENSLKSISPCKRPLSANRTTAKGDTRSTALLTSRLQENNGVKPTRN
jgi:hypothetical protein